MAGISTLTSLAMLKVNKDLRNTDYLDYLVPFVIEVLRVHKPDPVTDVDVGHHLNTDFGLRIPNRGILLVLNRLKKRGILSQEHQIIRISEELPKSDLLQRRSNAERQIEAVLDKLANFAAEHHGKYWNADTAGEVLTLYLSSFAVECLRTYIHNTALPTINKKGHAKDVVIVHSFVRDVHRESIADFENFMVVVKGHMLANALLCPDLQSLSRKFEDLVCYFDTNLILRLLGLDDPAANDSTRELFDLILSLKGTVAVFEHTVKELNGVLRAAESNFAKIGNRFSIVRSLLQQGKNASELTLIRSQLDARLKSLGIKRQPTPKHSAEFQIDEAVFGEALDEEVGYSNPNAKYHDINCVRSVFTLRHDSQPKRLEDARAVFVTSNASLAKAAFEYGTQFEHSREISSTITDFSLANVAWLKAPLGAPNLPEREVLAACFAALEPPNPLWEKYLAEVDSLKENGHITERDHAFLRYELRAREELMDLTLGEPEALTKVSIPTILERAKKEFVKEEQEKVSALTDENRQLRLSEDKRLARLFWFSGNVGRWAKYILAIALTVCAVLASGLIPDIWLSVLGRFSRIGAIVSSLLAVGGVLGFIDLVFGISVKDLLRKVEAFFAGKSYKLTHWLLMEESESPKRPKNQSGEAQAN